MRTRLITFGIVITVALSACSSGESPRSDLGEDAPARVNNLSEIARFALLSTKGEPLIDPTELIDAASFDGIPSIDKPVSIPREVADTELNETEQVMLVTHGGQARAYPVRSLIRHEIVNDVIAELPVAVTWCPLCNTGITFDRRVNGEAEVFGVSGGLYRSALVMFDRRTTSLWPQPLGKAVLGPLLGTELEVVASSLLPWKEVRDAHPDVAVVLASEDELAKTGENPYDGYDTSGDPFLFKGEVDERLPAFTRVAGVTVDGESKAWSYDVLRRRRAIDATVGGQPMVLLWAPGSASPLESDDVREGRDVGSTGVYDPRVGGRSLTFSPAGRTGFRDRETGSRWTLTGRATEGALAGEQLTPLTHQDAFWFAWAAFQPDTALVKQ
ncbi:MAG: DUF3179 domain-containing protein [Acidothermales bacterium]|jgi:hypothetical protein|nr:DUF3179 domain-containing protein [Acidothermales bacterium]